MTSAEDLSEVTLVGADYSVYTRICRLTLDLKGVRYAFEPLDVFAEGGQEAARQAGQPFGKIPILRHAGTTIYETLAITRYIDHCFDGPPLEPGTALGRARMNQIVSIVDTQVYPVLIWGLYVPGSEGREPDPAILDKARTVLSELEALAGEEWLCGLTPSLADAYLAGCMNYVLESAAGPDLPARCPRLANWWRKAQALAHAG